MIIYILKHSNSEFSGTLCGVGFSNGRGSTSSTFDRDRCIKNGCKDITDKVKSIQAAQKKKEEAKAAKADKAEDLKKKKAEEKAMVEAEKKAEKEKAPEEPPSKEPLEEKAEEPEKEKK
ncbi:MAG: hypothetical protein KAR42_16740 [candidate division Zixibacteria bacterium]|nr:hypothetical protein [candidate division Zixibacteria bacterium]